MRKNLFLLLISSLLLFSCSEFNKVVKSTDYEYKYKKALEYYEAKDYSHAISLFQDLVYVYRGTSKGDELYYYYAKSCYGDRDYEMAGHYFKTLVEQYPRSIRAEESQFMVGMCFYKQSPTPKLDQQVSKKAIDALQLFINSYPFSQKVEEANILIDELNEKVVYKSFLNAKLYYDMEYYKSAVIALNNSLNDYPDTKYREELKFLLLKSKYLLGLNSVEEKKHERLSDARDEYFIFVDEFPESKYVREAKRDFKQVSTLLGYKADNIETDSSKN
jgi:outer membrane protein assembly factor BamD